jgi:hypothetical protein
MADNYRPALEDQDLARHIGQGLGENLLCWGEPSFPNVRYAERPLVARELLRDILRGIERKSGARSALSIEVTDEFAEDLDKALRLIWFFRTIDIGGALVFKVAENEFGNFPLFDIFNPLARRSVSGQDEDAPLVEPRENWNDLIRWTNRFADRRDRIAVVDFRQALTGFMTLIADNLHAAAKAFANSGTSYLTYTVHANNSGYQLEYYPQYLFSPVVFGSTVTTPVSQRIKIGHYHFQGWRHNQLVQDSNLYFAAPGSTLAHLKYL